MVGDDPFIDDNEPLLEVNHAVIGRGMMMGSGSMWGRGGMSGRGSGHGMLTRGGTGIRARGGMPARGGRTPGEGAVSDEGGMSGEAGYILGTDGLTECAYFQPTPLRNTEQPTDVASADLAEDLRANAEKDRQFNKRMTDVENNLAIIDADGVEIEEQLKDVRRRIRGLKVRCLCRIWFRY